ncbi:NAD(P)-dependent alcohol dehydrogenase [Dyadobacter aurulentus]|uniref:NAD(P)-dependent alcohol dehydrogenase n=1 Tax=Dyadobacter sp. UC 10 TaxID=2605428 RepID=UPI0011F150E6|nr:NAD(P)-dependent alcohol dehydrogenase [Dyadobacter sp. UC 10]KAA0992625.1 NAD(P)-dependent alcohol dehydrogenase [Dyadobacter sp. UC 10]
MRAAIIEKYGEPEVFQIKEMPIPELKDGQVLIQNKASSVNPVDTLVRQGKTRLLTGLFGEHIIGSDFSGIVIKSQSAAFSVGTEVYGMMSAVKGGAYAEMIVVEESDVAAKPSNLSFTEAAVIPLVGLTAWQGLVVDGVLGTGQNVLVTGCTGGVGTMATQIAKHFGCTVTGTCSSENTAFAREVGVDHVIPFDEKEVPEQKQFDLIFDAAGNFTISDLDGSLKENALFVTTRAGADDLTGALEAAVDMLLRKRMKIVKVKPDIAHLYQLARLAESGELKPYIAETFGLEQLAAAHRKMEEGGFTGKIAVEI